LIIQASIKEFGEQMERNTRAWPVQGTGVKLNPSNESKHQWKRILGRSGEVSESSGESRDLNRQNRAEGVAAASSQWKIGKNSRTPVGRPV
jgi:hypothetical protein